MKFKIIPTSFLLLSWTTLIVYPLHNPFQISKCCPEGQKFDENFDCKGIVFDDYDETSNKSTNELSWFPISSIVNSTTLKIHQHHRDNYIKIFKEKYQINIGVKPKCSQKDSQQMAYFKEGIVESFNFIMFDDFIMKFYISKPGSLHDPENDIVQIEMINSTNAEFNKTIHPGIEIESLRLFPLEDACVDIGFDQIYFLFYCPCRTMTCVRKCCGDGEFFNDTSSLCQSIRESTLSIDSWRPEMSGGLNQYYLLSDTYPTCDNPIMLKTTIDPFKSCRRLNKDSDNEFTIFPDGSVKVKKYKRPYPSHRYCGEVTWHENGKIYEQNLILCSAAANQNTKRKPLKFTIYGILLVVGGICLLITVAVSLFLPELRRRIHNKIALSHNASLMVAYFAWGTAQLSPYLGDTFCIIISLLIQFSFLGSFFWLNVMCIDISMTFSSTRHLGGNSLSGETKKFIYYCIYSWGVTSIISIVTAVIEFLPEVTYDLLRPGFTCSCGFNTETASILIYLYGPMSILLIFNLVLFIFTTIKIMTIQRQTAILHKTDSNTTGGTSYQTDKQRYDLIQWLILYAKLFLLMGLTWVTEIVSWAAGGPDYYWYFSDILNLLRAVFIFILFICKKPVLMSLKAKIRGEAFGLSHKTGSSKSTTDVVSITTSGRDSRFRSSTSSNKRKESAKSDTDAHKMAITRQTSEIIAKNVHHFEESCI